MIDIVDIIPENKLMIETDAPFLTPRNLDEKPLDGRNEPKYLVHILDELSYHLGMDMAELAEQTFLNTKRFFNL